MNETTCIEVPVCLDFVDIMSETARQHGDDILVQHIISYCCDQSDYAFENKLSAALLKFQEENK
jgi:hypothetical protein